jgi:hypothetical protein
VAVHGLFYIGSESVCRDYLLIPKKAFDGVDPGIVKIENRADVILIDEPALGPKLKQLPKACGSYIYKYDAVVVGSVRRRDGGGYGVALTDLWMIVMQSSLPLQSGRISRSFCLVNFDAERLPSTAFKGLTEYGISVLALS